MRNIDSVIIKKAIIHVLDRNADQPILTDFEQEIDEDIHEFLERHIVKSLNSQENRVAKFKSDSPAMKNICKALFEDQENFIEASKNIAIQLFKVMKSDNLIPSADLVVCLYSAQDKDFIGILKLDYKTSYIHEIKFNEDKFYNQILPQRIGLPATGQQLRQCAFIKEIDEESEFDLVALDKFNYSEDESIQSFTNTFLACDVLLDTRDKTKLFKDMTEKWTRSNLKEDLDKAQEVREELIAKLKNGVEVDIEEFARNVFGNDVDLAKKYLQRLESGGLKPEKFEIDKKFVEKKMKKRVMKTDTGMEINGDFEDFEDRLKFEMKRNGDGTVDIVIKNVRCIMER